MSRRNLEECNLQKILCQDITILWSNAWAIALIQWKLCQCQVIHRTLDLLCALEVSGNQTRLTLACPWMRARLQVIIRHDHYVDYQPCSDCTVRFTVTIPPLLTWCISTAPAHRPRASFLRCHLDSQGSWQTGEQMCRHTSGFPSILDYWLDWVLLGRALCDVKSWILSKTSRSPVYISSGGTINILCRKLHAKTPPCSDTVSYCLQWSHLERQIKESSM